MQTIPWQSWQICHVVLHDRISLVEGGRLVGRGNKFCLNTSVDWPHHGNSENNNPVKAVGERAGMRGSKSVLWTNRKAVSLASFFLQRLHVSCFHHNIQVGLLPLIGQTSVLIPSHHSGQKKKTTAGQLCHLYTSFYKCTIYYISLQVCPDKFQHNFFFSSKTWKQHRFFFFPQYKARGEIMQAEWNTKILSKGSSVRLWAAFR